MVFHMIATTAGFGSILKIIMITAIIWKLFSRDCSDRGSGVYTSLLCITIA